MIAPALGTDMDYHADLSCLFFTHFSRCVVRQKCVCRTVFLLLSCRHQGIALLWSVAVIFVSKFEMFVSHLSAFSLPETRNLVWWRTCISQCFCMGPPPMAAIIGQICGKAVAVGQNWKVCYLEELQESMSSLFPARCLGWKQRWMM